MKVLNFGSLNYDLVYHVDHAVMPGETIASTQLETFSGGKGLNQSIALSKAGANVYHAGMIGEDGDKLRQTLMEHQVKVDFVEQTEGKSGHAIIQLDKDAGNCILLYGGSNRKITKEYVDAVLSHFEKGDVLLLQNEINHLSYIIDEAYEKGMRIVLNPSPFDEALQACDLCKIEIFVLNEIEGAQISGQKEPTAILSNMHEMYKNSHIVLTLGKDGAIYSDGKFQHKQPIVPTKAVDTTAAGDTFTGYFIAGWMKGEPVEQIMQEAAMASSIAVSRMGAAPSIPYEEEVRARL